jgi:hypothetical protein
LQRLCWCVDLLGMKLARTTGLYQLNNILEGCRPVKSVLKGFIDQHAGRRMIPTLASMDLCEQLAAFLLSYPIFMPKLSTHRMHDPGSIVPYIRPKVFTEIQMSRIKYDYYYINSVSKDYDDSQRNGTAEDSILHRNDNWGNT